MHDLSSVFWLPSGDFECWFSLTAAVTKHEDIFTAETHGHRIVKQEPEMLPAPFVVHFTGDGEDLVKVTVGGARATAPSRRPSVEDLANLPFRTELVTMTSSEASRGRGRASLRTGSNGAAAASPMDKARDNVPREYAPSAWPSDALDPSAPLPGAAVPPNACTSTLARVRAGSSRGCFHERAAAELSDAKVASPVILTVTLSPAVQASPTLNPSRAGIAVAASTNQRFWCGCGC